METTKIRTNVYLNSDMKQKAQEIFKLYGLGMSEAFNIFLTQTVLNRGLPFEVKVPNNETIKAIEDVEKGINVEKLSLNDFKDILNDGTTNTQGVH
jgi:DNA-damage-inducible protein J